MEFSLQCDNRLDEEDVYQLIDIIGELGRNDFRLRDGWFLLSPTEDKYKINLYIIEHLLEAYWTIEFEGDKCLLIR
jgi:hypothetical protein